MPGDQIKRADDEMKLANTKAVNTLKIDVSTGLTRAGIALQASQHSEKRLRNQREARKAYDSVVGWMQRLDLTRTDAKEITDGLAQLKLSLEQLGESFT